MSTLDYWTEGEGPCPCGKGMIVVTGSQPDHPWAKGSQISYTGALKCDVCKETYIIVDTFASNKPRLVLKMQEESARRASETWQETHRDIAALPAFKQLQVDLAGRLGQERSAAARHRALLQAGIDPGSIQKYRKFGYELRTGDAAMAIKLVGTNSEELREKVRVAEAYWQAHHTPPGIKTGISGMEM